MKKSREDLVRQLDVTTVLPRLRAANMFTDDEERRIMSDPRRRVRVSLFLDALEKKNSATFKAFCDVLSSHNPHLYLIVSEWDKDDDRMKTNPYGINIESNFKRFCLMPSALSVVVRSFVCRRGQVV